MTRKQLEAIRCVNDMAKEEFENGVFDEGCEEDLALTVVEELIDNLDKLNPTKDEDETTVLKETEEEED